MGLSEYLVVVAWRDDAWPGTQPYVLAVVDDQGHVKRPARLHVSASS